MSHNVKMRMVTALVLALVFVAGIGVGLVWDEPFGQAVAGEAEAVVEPEGIVEPEEDREREESSRGATIHRVDLTEDQRARADSMLARFRAELAEFQEESQLRYWAIVDEARDSLKTVLNLEQQALYDSLLAERDRERGRPAAPRP